MKRTSTIRGRIEEHVEGLEPTEEMVRKRAREIAIANGRRADQVNEADWEEARRHFQHPQEVGTEDEDDQAEVVPRDTPLEASSGGMAHTRLPTDEQTVPDDLVQEGVEEAEHERMVEGNRESRRRDDRFQDQLPDVED